MVAGALGRHRAERGARHPRWQMTMISADARPNV